MKTLLYFLMLIIIGSGFQADSFEVSKEYLLGKVKPQNDTNFVKISTKYTTKSNIYMEKDSYAAYKKMYEAAKQDGIELRIISAFRSFNYQKWIWERKWTGKRGNYKTKFPDEKQRAFEILKYSSMPGISRHHWGTDIDIYKLNNSAFESGYGKKLYDWMQDNAAKFGYYQAYTKKDSLRPKGFNEEKWHWSYKPVAKVYLSNYKIKISASDISGFYGDKFADSSIIENYVFGINTELKD